MWTSSPPTPPLLIKLRECIMWFYPHKVNALYLASRSSHALLPTLIFVWLWAHAAINGIEYSGLYMQVNISFAVTMSLTLFLPLQLIHTNSRYECSYTCCMENCILVEINNWCWWRRSRRMKKTITTNAHFRIPDRAKRWMEINCVRGRCNCRTAFDGV